MNPTSRLFAYAMFGLSVVWTPAIAQSSAQFQQLSEAVAGRLLPIPDSQKLVDCSHTNVSTLESSQGSGLSQWIFNGLYDWRYIEIGGGTCVFLRQPEHRGLTQEKARTLMSASRLEFPVDPAIAAKEQAYGDWAKALASFGGSATEEHGSVNGYIYRIRYMGIGASLAPLDQAQHHFAQQEKEALALQRSRGVAESTPDSTFALDVEFSSGGRTKELAVVVADGHRVGGEQSPDRIHADWMLHIPSGRLVTFNDLFVDPRAAREHFSAVFRHSPQFRNDFYVILNDEEKAREFNAAYEAANLQASSPITEHFRHLMIGTADLSKPSLIIDFTMQNLLPDVQEFPHLELSAEYFRDLLKPEYRTAFNGMSYPH